MSIYPDFMIIGAARSGTSSLHKNLELHPQLSGPKVGSTQSSGYDKEIHFFDKSHKFNRGLKWYLQHFDHPGPDVLRFESTPNYLYIPEVPGRIKKSLPNWEELKFIIMLRDPVKRAWSHFWHWRDRHNKTPEFLMSPNSDWIKKGIYIDQIKNWHKHFDEKQFLIIKSEDYFNAAQSIIVEVHKFLGIQVIYIVDAIYFDPKKVIQSRLSRYPKIPGNIKDWLIKFYGPHNKKLFGYLGAEFEDWL